MSLYDFRLNFTEKLREQFPDPYFYLDNQATILIANWKSLAMRELNTSRADYVNSIVKEPIERTANGWSVKISLVGQLANKIEQGSNPYDMKEGLLAGQPYRKIFFRKGTPASKRLIPMSSAQHRAMKQVSTSSDRGSFPPFIEKMPKLTAYGVFKFDKNDTRGQERKTNKRGYQHKEHIYQRMQKMVLGRTSIYGTFRTVSRKSESDSWFHPGFTAERFLDKVISEMGWDLE